jgi:hypothetical protein
MNRLRLFGNGDSSTRRLQARRRPIVEDLEGRQLLSGIVGNHIGTSVAMIQGNHIGTRVAMVKGGHIGTSVAMVKGGHGPYDVADVQKVREAAVVQRQHLDSAMIQGAHIGSAMIVGQHIGC